MNMKCGLTSAAILAVTVSFATALIGTAADDPADRNENAQKPEKANSHPKALSDFMRVKLQASQQILEGLALENLDLVQSGAQTLHKLSGAEKWRVYNDAMYRQFSSEFQRNTQELEKAARENNLDQAAVKWFATTMSCIECHRYVRNNLVVSSEDQQ